MRATKKRKPKIEYVKLDEIGFDLREEREKRGWSQRYMARLIGSSYQSYQNWEQGLTKAVFPKIAEKIIAAFETPVEDVDSLGIDFKTERERGGIQKKKIADMIGISTSAYKSIEEGDTKLVEKETAKKIKEVFEAIKEAV